MELLRNVQIRRELYIGIAAALLLTTAAYLVAGVFCALFTFAAALCFAGLHFISAYQRYRAIHELTRELDRLLHTDAPLLMTEYREGELSALYSEIHKLFLRLRTNADALQAEKQRLTEAIADISHQLRTPLTSLNLVVVMLSEKELPAVEKTRLLRALRKGLAGIDWLIETLLKLSKIDAGSVQFQKEPVALKLLLQRAAAPLDIPIEVRGQTLRITAEEKELTCDLRWTAEAVGNIIKNCMEHTPEGGLIELTATQTPLYTQITVTDTGSGIEPQDLPHLFERFYRGKNASSDSFGIGLALARTILMAQNGTIKAENRPEGGARFTLRLYKGVV